MKYNNVKKFIKLSFPSIIEGKENNSLENFFNIEDFQFIKGKSYIDSISDLVNWYYKLRKLLLIKNYKINSIFIDTIEDGYYALLNINLIGILNSNKALNKTLLFKFHIKKLKNNLKIRRFEIVKNERRELCSFRSLNDFHDILRFKYLYTK